MLYASRSNSNRLSYISWGQDLSGERSQMCKTRTKGLHCFNVGCGSRNCYHSATGWTATIQLLSLSSPHPLKKAKVVADFPIGDLVTGSSHGATSPKCCITLSILLLFTLRHLHWDQVRNKGHTFITKVLPAVTRKQILAEEMEGGKKKTNHKFLIFNVNVQKCNNIFCCIQMPVAPKCMLKTLSIAKQFVTLSAWPQFHSCRTNCALIYSVQDDSFR